MVFGEFVAMIPPQWSSRGISEYREFRLTGHAYQTPHAEDPDQEIWLVDYDPSWPQQFEDFATTLRALLGPNALARIEHYGSTAIPGMVAEPVLDVLLEPCSFAEARPRLLTLLGDPNWEYWDSGHVTLVKRKHPHGWRTHRVDMAPRGSVIWRALALRDYLRSSASAAAEYAALKIRMAEVYPYDREGYVEGKTPFLETTTAKALADREIGPGWQDTGAAEGPPLQDT